MANAEKSFKSNTFLLDETNHLYWLKLNIDNQKNTDTKSIASTLTVVVTDKNGWGKVKLLIQVLIIKLSTGKAFSTSYNTLIIDYCANGTSSFVLPSQEKLYPGIDYLRNYEDNDTLTFKCIIKEVVESFIVEKPITDPDYKIKITSTKIFTSLYRNNELFDVTLITGNERIQAHAVVLAAICPYFRKMFNSGMKEQRERTVDFSNDSEISPKILRGLLDYTYGVKSVEELKDIASEMLILALKFDIEDLKKPCEFIVSNGINTTNIASTLLFAHKYNLKILKDKALNITKMHVKLI